MTFLLSLRSDNSVRVDEVAPGFRATGYQVVITQATPPTQAEIDAAIAPKIAERQAENDAAAARVTAYTHLGDDSRTAAQHIATLRVVARQIMRIIWDANGKRR